ncbi:cell wall-binding repeat-containing protein [Salinibacterium sp. UTAS2018]|uniref:cell wall-binding repeat-containing protein n=1 Tax=Salinibacterium sp. UTAS2018 TaxID=2508880 RepID=UPI001009681E|nr:cell wall-binding repeat-containing protein [Salinibacterium sp. UTAS2018]QAV70814.1 cell wall-binding repeat-containing protein [Salinibacterium sp. UTAS2018]
MSTLKDPSAQKKPPLAAKRSRRIAAIGSTALLVVGVSVTAALPANAAASAPTTEACTAITAGPTATNQNAKGWTFADTRATGHNEFTATGLRVWTDGTTSTDKAAAYKATDIALQDVGEPLVNFVSNSGGVPSLQLVTDFDANGTADGILVGEPLHYGADFWVPDHSSTAQFVKDGSPDSTGSAGSQYHGTLDEWLEEFPTARVLQFGYSLGSGVLGDAVIESIEVGCVSYGFGRDDAYSTSSTVNVDDSQIASFEDGNTASATYNYTSWHEGYNNAHRAYSTAADGLHLGTGATSQIMLGTPGTVSAAQLEELITSASVTTVDGKVTFQIPILYGDASSFTTLRSTALLAGTEHHFDVTDTWVSSKPLKLNSGATYTPANAPTIADLVAFLEAQGNITLLGFGVQADNAAIVQDIAFDDTTYHFGPSSLQAATQQVVVTSAQIQPSETSANYTQWHEGYDNTDVSFSVANGVLSFGDPAHSQILKGLTTPIDGSDLYTQLTRHAAVTVDSGTVTYQVAFKHGGTIGWGTLRSASLPAGENTFSLTDPWKSSKAIGNTIVANTEYPLGDILDALNAAGDARATAFGIQADHAAQVSSLTWGNTEYSFHAVITAATPAINGTPQVGETLTAQPKATTWTPDTGVAFSYQWKANGVAIAGATSATYTVAAAQLGKKITVTVTGALSGYTGAAATSPSTASVTNDHIVVSRLSGSDRYATAATIAQEWDSASVVYIATGTGFADALSASSAAAFKDAPLLLTDPNSLSAAAKAELLRLKPSKVIIVGGTGAVSNSVKSSIQALSFKPTVSRIGGGDRYETSRMIAKATFPASSVTTAYLADGSNFPDALTASPAAANFGGPVVLIPGKASTVDTATVTLLKSLGVTSIKVAGGTGAVTTAISTHLKTKFTTVKRLSGGDRYATAVAINADQFSSATTVYLATGAGFADALAGAALAGSEGAPLFISDAKCVPQSVLTAISSLNNPKVVLLGGTGVLSSSVASLKVCS